MKNLTKLRGLDISNTDIYSSLEHLPNSIEVICCSSQKRPASKVKGLEEQLKESSFFDFEDDKYIRNWKEIHPDFTFELTGEWKCKNCSYEQCQAWIEKGLNPNDYAFVAYLESKGYNPQQENLNLDEWRIKWDEINKKPREWLDQNYPKENRSEVEAIYLTEPTLAGELDLSGFTYYYKLDFNNEHGIAIYVSSQVDEKKINFKNKPKKVRFIKLVQAQKWLDENYPPNGTCVRKNESVIFKNEDSTFNIDNFGKKREEITKLNISAKQLDGSLNLNDFVNLKELRCHNNKLTSLDLTNCEQLEEIDCCWSYQLTNLSLPKYCPNLTELNLYTNQLTDLNFLSVINPEKLKELGILSNNFPETDLSIFSSFTNLEVLQVGNSKWNIKQKINQNIYNRFYGSLESLENLTKLQELDISNTDINEVNIDKLPRSLEYIEYSTEARPSCKLTEIVPLLEKHFGKHGRCLKCFQLNTSKKWCHPCTEKEWQEDLKTLTGQELVEKFIQSQPRRYKDLKWIPYEQFTDIKYLAEGGFSKVYKTIWKKDEKRWNEKEEKWEEILENVVLKSFNNSQNITLEFLTEVANTHLFGGRGWGTSSVSGVYGISQDPITKNYAIVERYEGVNLREYLQNRYHKLSLKDKFERLRIIAEGLGHIRHQNLIHRDLHSGNILNGSKIVDLGFSHPANYQKEEGKIFGIMPYVAPEVLQSQPYTLASDIYSWGIVAYEFLANAYPYSEYEELKDLDSNELAKKIIENRLRPNIDKVPVPQEVKDLIKSCWDADPEKRPTTERLCKIVRDWDYEITLKKDNSFYQQYLTIKDEYNNFSQNTPYKIHPDTITRSKLINTKQITELLQKSKELILKEEEKKIQKKINLLEFQLSSLKIALDKQKQEKFDQFVTLRKNYTRSIDNEALEEEIIALEDSMEEIGFLEKTINEIKKLCDQVVKLEVKLENEINNGSYQAMIEQNA